MEKIISFANASRQGFGGCHFGRLCSVVALSSGGFLAFAACLSNGALLGFTSRTAYNHLLLLKANSGPVAGPPVRCGAR